MLHGLILKVTQFQLPSPKRLSTVVKNILGGHHAPPPCQIGLKAKNWATKFTLKTAEKNLNNSIVKIPLILIRVKLILRRSVIILFKEIRTSKTSISLTVLGSLQSRDACPPPPPLMKLTENFGQRRLNSIPYILQQLIFQA